MKSAFKSPSTAGALFEIAAKTILDEKFERTSPIPSSFPEELLNAINRYTVMLPAHTHSRRVIRTLRACQLINIGLALDVESVFEVGTY